MDSQDDERREAASAGLLALMNASPPAAGPAGYPLDAEAEAEEAHQIAARLDERARQNTKYITHERYNGGDIGSRMPSVHDAPMWRLRVRVSDHKLCSVCLLTR
jgi:hypothetical protein